MKFDVIRCGEAVRLTDLDFLLRVCLEQFQVGQEKSRSAYAGPRLRQRRHGEASSRVVDWEIEVRRQPLALLATHRVVHDLAYLRRWTARS